MYIKALYLSNRRIQELKKSRTTTTTSRKRKEINYDSDFFCKIALPNTIAIVNIIIAI